MIPRLIFVYRLLHWPSGLALDLEPWSLHLADPGAGSERRVSSHSSSKFNLSIAWSTFRYNTTRAGRFQANRAQQRPAPEVSNADRR